MFEISPTFLLSLGIAILAGIGWLIRLESKTSTNTRDIEVLSKDFYDHDKNLNVHHDGAELDRRFSVLENGLVKIEKLMERLVERFDRFLSK